MENKGLVLPNTPFPGCSKPLFRCEAKFEAADLKMILYSHAKSHFQIKRFRNKPRFESESIWNSEMAYSVQ